MIVGLVRVGLGEDGEGLCVADVVKVGYILCTYVCICLLGLKRLPDMSVCFLRVRFGNI